MAIRVIGAVWIGVSKVCGNKNPEEQKWRAFIFQYEPRSYVLTLVYTKPLQLQATAFEPYSKVATKRQKRFIESPHLKIRHSVGCSIYLLS
jgi:hypothetical protein